jgi:hypothetical protein
VRSTGRSATRWTQPGFEGEGCPTRPMYGSSTWGADRAPSSQQTCLPAS